MRPNVACSDGGNVFSGVDNAFSFRDSASCVPFVFKLHTNHFPPTEEAGKLQHKNIFLKTAVD